MDGSVGHGNKKYKSIENDIEGLKRDLIKNELAKNNNITLYRIDCTSNDYHIIILYFKIYIISYKKYFK